MFQLKECIFWINVPHCVSTFWNFRCLSEVIQILHLIFETRSQFKPGVSLHHFVKTQLEHKCKAKLKGDHLRKSKREPKGQGWDSNPNKEGVLFPRHFDNSLSVYLFLEFQPQLGKSEKFNNQGMKENKTFRIPFITKKQLKSTQVLHRIFLKPQYKVYRGALILYFNASFSDVPSSSKISQPPGQNQKMVNSFVFHPCPSKLASRLTFIRHLTLINTNLIKKKNQPSLSNKV